MHSKSHVYLTKRLCVKACSFLYVQFFFSTVQYRKTASGMKFFLIAVSFTPRSYFILRKTSSAIYSLSRREFSQKCKMDWKCARQAISDIIYVIGIRAAICYESCKNFDCTMVVNIKVRRCQANGRVKWRLNKLLEYWKH